MEYIIENEFLRAAVSTHGGELVSVIDRETGAEMIWQADPGVWDRMPPFCSRTAARCAAARSRTTA